MPNKVMITCAVTGSIHTPSMSPHLPVTPEEMASATQQAYDAGASVVHCHFRDQREGMGAFPTWDPDTVGDILNAIKRQVPEIIICMSTGVLGADISEVRDTLSLSAIYTF